MMQESQSYNKIKLQDFQQTEIKAAVIIQKWFRGVITRQFYQIFTKKMFLRKRVIQQMMQTQQNYIGDLALLISDFKMQLESQKILTSSEIKAVFSNIDEIRKLNQQFYVSLYTQYQSSKQKPFVQVFKEAWKQVSFFKIYFEYFNNFTSANLLVSQLQKNNIKFDRFLQQKRVHKKYRNLSLSDFLIKPVQRLPKYVILLKELKKRTPQDHPDYPNVVQLLAAFQDVNTSNNDKLNKVLNNYKLSEIQSALEIRDLAQPGIDFVGEEPVTLLSNDHKTIEALMYLLNNQIILRKIRTSVLLERVYLTHGTTLIQGQDGQFFKNTLCVQNSEGDSFTILCSSIEEKKTLFGKLSYLIFSAKKNCMDKAILMFKTNKASDSFLKRMALLDLIPQVAILGTSERQSKLFKYTIYIIQVKIKMIRQKIFLRYSEILEIQEDLKKEFPELEIKNNLLVSSWILNHKPRTIQQRKMNILRFLKQILSKPEVMQSGHKILYKLGLPYDLYDMPRKFQKSQEFFHNSFKGSIKKSVKKSQGKMSAHRMSVYTQQQQDLQVSKVNRQDVNLSLNLNDLLKANQHLLGHYSRISEAVDKDVIQSVYQIKVSVFVAYLQSKKECFKRLNFTVQSYHRIQHLIGLVAKQLQINYCKDFRIFLQRSYAQRIVDNDELVSKVNEQIVQSQYCLVFKKLIFISHEMQVKQIAHDEMRTRMMASQIICDVSRGRYNLDYQKYLILSVLIRVIIQQCQPKQKIVKKTEKNQYRESQSKQKSYSEPQNWLEKSKNILFPKYTCIQNKQEWDEDAQQLYLKVRKILYEVSQDNMHQIRTSMIPTSDFLCDLSTLAHFAIIQEMQSHHLYGAYPFMIQATSEQYKKFVKQKSVLQETKNLWLSVNYAKVMIVSLCLNKVYYEFEHREVAKIQTFPASILIHLKNGKQFALKTSCSYQIRELINYYNHYQGVVSRIIKDPLFFQSIILENEKERLQSFNQENDLANMREKESKMVEQKFSKFKQNMEKQKIMRKNSQ